MQAIRASSDFKTYLQNVHDFTSGSYHSWWLPNPHSTAKVHDQFIDVIEKLVLAMQKKGLWLLSIGPGHGVLEEYVRMKGIRVVTIESFDIQYDRSIVCKDGERYRSFFDGKRIEISQPCTKKVCEKQKVLDLFNTDPDLKECTQAVLFCSYPPPKDKSRHMSHYFEAAMAHGLKKAVTFLDARPDSSTSLEAEEDFVAFKACCAVSQCMTFARTCCTQDHEFYESQDQMTFYGDVIER